MSDNRYWSVTTLIGAGVPKEALVGWAARTVAEYAVNEREGWLPLAERDPEEAINLLKGIHRRRKGKAADRGNEIHKVAEAYALGIEPPKSDLPHVEQFRRFLADHSPEYVMSEAPVYNPEYRYAGTLDAIAMIGGKRCILDIKTTDKLWAAPGMKPPYPEVALQAVAYARAKWVGLDPAEMRTHRGGKRYYLWNPAGRNDPMPEIEGAYALALGPDWYNLVPLRIDDEVWRAFLAVREVARWKLDVSRRVLGPPVEPAKENAA